MDRIVIIGASYLQVPLVKKAKDLGIETHVFAWEKGATARTVADAFYPISITEKDKILDLCRRINPVGVASIASDLAVPTVNYVARELGLTCNPIATDFISTNKYAMRKALKNAGLTVPAFSLVENHCDINRFNDFSYPVIVKATDRSGSRGVTLVDNKLNLQDAIRNAILESFEKKAIVEEYIPGEEYSCESISYDGKHHVLAVTKKYTTGAPHFIEIAHLEPSGVALEHFNRIKVEVIKALDALQIRYGASHAEFKITPSGEIIFIEIGSRMGGDCIGSDLVPLSTGCDYVRMVIDVACGHTPDTGSHSKTYHALCRFLFNREDFEEYKQIAYNNPQLIYKSTIDTSANMDGRVVDSSTRHGMYILRSESLEELEKYFPEG